MADARRLEVTLDVPPNTFAEVVLPGEVRSLWVNGGRPVPGAGGVVRISPSVGARRVTLSWGHHVVSVELLT